LRRGGMSRGKGRRENEPAKQGRTRLTNSRATPARRPEATFPVPDQRGVALPVVPAVGDAGEG
jgi:hypothetical protein